jgi:poly(3-hydroxybutyrate) depolymerase
MHPPGKNSKEELDGWADLWDEYCRKHHIILVMPVEKQDGWQPTHADFIVAAVRETQKTYTIDNQRIVANGMGRGGEMALFLAFNHRDLFRGALVSGCTALSIKDNVPNQRLSFFLFGGDFDPIQKHISDSRTRMAERRFPAFYKAMPERGRDDYLSAKAIAEALRWLETLDQQ